MIIIKLKVEVNNLAIACDWIYPLTIGLQTRVPIINGGNVVTDRTD